ncbi:YciI family protein [Luteolibacter soli]|uniref:YciI family protein n=1 Tax=Luteolibacter soli TaxID=3135280 RepID=A0ABU9AXQ7_9BACT
MYIADPQKLPSGVFLYTLRPVRPAMLAEGPTAEEQALAGAHWQYSIDLLKRGVVVFGGRTMTRDSSSFAPVVIRAASMEAARAIVEGDPAVAGGVFHAEIFPFQPMLMGEWPQESATVTSGGVSYD